MGISLNNLGSWSRCNFSITRGLFKRVKMRDKQTDLVSVCLHANCADISSKKRNQFVHKYFIRAIWRLWRASGSRELLNYCYHHLMCVLLLKMQSKSHERPLWKQDYMINKCIISNNDKYSLVLYLFLCLQMYFVLIERGYTERQNSRQFRLLNLWLDKWEGRPDRGYFSVNTLFPCPQLVGRGAKELILSWRLRRDYADGSEVQGKGRKRLCQ